MKAYWNGRVIAASDDTIVVEGNHYFPPSSVNSAPGAALTGAGRALDDLGIDFFTT